MAVYSRMKKPYPRYFSFNFNQARAFAVVATLSCFAAFGPVFAQTTPTKNVVQLQARAADSHTLRAGADTVLLWGTEEIKTGNAHFYLKARMALDNLIGSKPVQCEVMGRNPAGQVLAQCSNAEGIDLGLYMLQQGYLVADRSVVYGSILEEHYIAAETQAYSKGIGVWAAEESENKAAKSFGADNVAIISFVVFLVLVAAFAVASLVMFRGFRKVAAAQDRNTDILSKERVLKDKEKNIVASMLEAELKANQSKIEAYLVVYEEMLKSLRDPSTDKKYRRSGDIVQLQPALDRSVFDGNTDKMDLLGRKLSSAVIHFYARIKTRPDYVNIDPDMPLEKALIHVEKAVGNARILNEILGKVLSAFSKMGIGNDSSREEE